MATNRCTYYNGQREGNFSTCKNPCIDDVEIYCVKKVNYFKLFYVHYFY